MKKIVLSLPPIVDKITIDRLDSYLYLNDNRKSVIIYKRKSSDSYCMLVKLNKDHSNFWGWIPIGELSNNPTYTSNSLSDTVRMVVESGRDVRVFDNIFEFTAAVNRKEY